MGMIGELHSRLWLCKRSYFLIYVDKQFDKSNTKNERYWINIFTNKKEGKHSVYRQADNLEEVYCHYKNGKKHGKYEEWYLSSFTSDKFIKVRCNYKDDKKHGRYQEWNIKGNKIKDCWYKDYKLHGSYMSWYENGNKMKDYYYKDGKYNGKCVYYNPHGIMTISTYHLDGEYEGKREEWYDNGKKEIEC
ncbi:MORN-repeat protein [Orpheovirus IHUMI-LCC2]|uniref:MORN-repeat protein n=1 Tax=Orpheovirus IHUMI-LCC2 TaxID=2023057 RepID=A0A2I2L4N8_9VIRU|nr:MORN-repeat protein [Orpheovirus IHUMI-LCC2]SNW62512.1 MORN-repeat protein [Orpheovirus IHUMI-LCC2]